MLLRADKSCRGTAAVVGGADRTSEGCVVMETLMMSLSSSITGAEERTTSCEQNLLHPQLGD